MEMPKLQPKQLPHVENVKQRPVRSLVWKAEGIPRSQHPSFEASAGKGCYRIGPVFDFHMKFAGYSVHHRADKSNFKNIRAAGFAPTAEKAKAIAQHDYDQGGGACLKPRPRELAHPLRR
jgi:hypothetical protein